MDQQLTYNMQAKKSASLAQTPCCAHRRAFPKAYLISLVAALPFLFSTVAEAGRREREKVSAALLLWKLHTQGKAFAALAAHRLRRSGLSSGTSI